MELKIMAPFHVVTLNPVAFRAFGEPIAWYWLVYLFGFIWIYFGLYFFSKVSKEKISSAMTWGWFGMFLGARAFYILFYFPSHYLQNPDQILAIWNGGMSFHGGCLGAVLAIWVLNRTDSKTFLRLMDGMTLLLPVPIALGRLANLANQELVGRVTDVSWAIILPHVDHLPRHPSQIYEAFAEGVLLFSCLLLLRNFVKKTPGLIASSFLILYGAFRFFTEFFREPDQQVGFVFQNLTLGQMLCVLTSLLGLVCFVTIKRHKALPASA